MGDDARDGVAATVVVAEHLAEETPDGRERGEQPVDAASRETNEEIGIEPASLIRLLSYFPSPGIGQEEITLYLGIIDAATLPARAGLASEKEVTLPILVSIDAALAALESGTIHNGPLIIALQWLALHRSRLPELRS